MRLADFILANIEPILTEWEAFARSVWPGAVTDPATLRDHAEDMLRAAAADMKSDQTAKQQSDKSKGKGDGGPESDRVNRASESHGIGRMGSGFELAALIAEYRALRASVIRLWREDSPTRELNDLDDLIRFNESIDQSLTEAVVAFAKIVGQERQAALDEHSQRALELRELNDALLTSSIHQHESTEKAEKAEGAARESEQRYRALFDLGPVAVYACDAMGVIRDFNRRAVELWGRTPQPGDTDERFCGSHHLFHPDGSFMPHAQCPMADVVSGKIAEVRDAEVIIGRPDGSQVTVIVNILPLKNERNEVTGAINCFYDITDRKQAENALDMAREQAETANRSKDRFLAVLSHELRTPLTPVLTTVQLMERDTGLSDEIRKAASMIRRNIELEARLIDDLLDLTRISRGKLDLQITTVDVHEQLRHVMEMCNSDVRARMLHVAEHLEATEHHVPGDVARLQQVLWNLLKNAVKFTPIGRSIIIRTSVTEAGRFCLTVQDAGIGIARDMLPKIFDAFEQGDIRTSRQFGGLGLGLSISKALVDLHGGTLIASSDGLGKGATFTLELPVAVPNATAPLTQAPLPERTKSIGPCRVLVVEDNDDTARAMTRLLRAGGYEVRIANTVAAALRVAGAEPFDVVISDIGLPDGSGLDLMRQLTIKFALKGIALSGYGMEEDVQRSKQAGFAEHITKPVDIARLEQAVRRIAGAAGC